MPRLLHTFGALRGPLLLAFALLSCSAFGQLNVTVTGEDITCFGLSSGTATAAVNNGESPYTYAWSNGGNTSTITNLTAGDYDVTVTDANGLTGLGMVTLTEPTRVTATITEPTECEGPYIIAAEPEGGVIPYTFNWSTGADTRAVTVPAGDYCVTVVDANLCGYVACTVITPNPPTVTVVDVDITCTGADDGAITANPDGGVPPYTYAWTGGGTGQTITGLSPGAYRVTLTDSRGCTATATTLINEPDPLVGNIFGDVSVCPGVVDAFIRIAPSGGTPPYTYLWSPGGATGQGIGAVGAGVYSVTVTDANNCTLVDTYEVVESPEVEIEITGDLLLCGAATTGTLSASPLNGPVSQYTYEWNTGATSPSITGVGAGNYSVTATDVNGCTGTANATVITIDLNLSLSSTPLTCSDSDDGTATATATGGDMPYTYLWSNGETTATITGLAAGVYGVTVTEANDCKVSGNVLVGAPDPLSITANPGNVSCGGADDGTIEVAVTGGTPAYTFLWSDGVVSEDRTGLAAGSYGVTVTDANGCTANTTVQIIAPDALVITPEIINAACAGENTGAISLTVSGGTPAYSYAWSNGASTRIITGLGAGSYTVTVTDANECELIATYSITEPVALVVTGVTTDVDCFGESDGSIDLTVSGGTPAYGYTWSNGATTEDISGLVAGAYRVTVTDANECTDINTFIISQPTDLMVGATPTNVSCAGADDGTINVSVSGGTQPYAFAWNNGAETEDLSALAAGTYSLTVTDANGCTETVTIQVTAPTTLVITPSVTNVSCTDDADGSINLNVSGGTPAYSFAWSNGATTQSINNLTAGDYTVTVTDANDCTLTATYTVTAPNAIVVTGVVTNIDCFGDNDGAVDLTVSGGSPGYSIAWSNGATSEDISGLAAGDYTVTVTDANECTETRTFTITEPTELMVGALPTNVSCNGADDGAIDATTSGGTQPYTFSWSNGADTEDLSGLVAGTYSLTVTDANGCTDFVSVTVSEPLALNGFAEITPVACTGEATGAINLTAERGTAPYTFSWSNGAITEDISGLTAGMYTVTITDANDCSLVQIYEVRTVDGIVINGVVTPVTCEDESDGSIDVTVSGGSAPYAFTWSNGALVEDISGLAAGTYTVTVTDANECSLEETFMITEPDAIELSITAPNISCGGTSSGSITVFPAGGTAPYTYLWSNGDTGSTIDEIPAGIYTVTVTDVNGCTNVTNGISLEELPELACEVVIDQQSTDGTNGQLTVNVDGGTQPYTYVWSNGATTPTISNLTPGTYSVTATDFNGCTTQCNATLRALAGLGDFVWQDFNANGQQDPGEPGIEDYPVYLKNAVGVIIDSTRTDANGNYAFLGLEPGTYSVLFIEPPGGIRTLANTGDDATDSDGDPDMDGMTDTYTLVAGEFNMTVDAGFFAAPDGAITDPCNCLNNNTTDFDGQFTEILEVRSNPGQTWTILANSNMFFLNSPNPPAEPNPVPAGTVIPQVSVDGDIAVYSFEFLLVDSFQYTTVLTNGVYTLEIGNQCFYPVVRYEEEPPESICRFDVPFLLDGFGLINNQPLAGEVIFTVNGVVVTEIDPSSLLVGENTIIASFVPENDMFCIADEELRFLLVDECDAKLGDFVWQDTNGNGQQDPGEPGIEGVKVTVTSQDGTYMDMAFTDDMGMYMFAVPPGTYKVTFDAPDEYVPTTANTGNDELDSDMDPVMLMTGFYTVGPDEMDFTIDAGFINPCIANIVNPGTIAASQEICGPGNVPQPLVEIAPATGGEGNIQYLWMFNTEDPTQDISFWQPIPNSNTVNYAPGLIYETTYFTRCVRRNNCQYIESNVITIEVGDDAVAEVSGPNVVCVGEEAIFQAVNPGNGAQISWNFTGSSAVESATGSTVTTSWATFGSFSATLTVTANGCTSTRIFNVAVVNNPSRCGGSLTANGAVNDLQTRDVTIEWEVPADGTDYAFVLERSTNGIDFVGVADVSVPAFVSGNDMAMFRHGDISPLAGRTLYRVRMVDAQNGDMLSNVVEIQLASVTSSALGRIFPNPAVDGMIHVEMTEMSTDDNMYNIELFDVRGNMVAPRIFVDPGTGIINLPMNGGAAGVYFLRITRGAQTETHRVIIN